MFRFAALWAVVIFLILFVLLAFVPSTYVATYGVEGGRGRHLYGPSRLADVFGAGAAHVAIARCAGIVFAVHYLLGDGRYFCGDRCYGNY